MATSKLPASLIQLAHQLQTFRRVGSSFTDEFDNETILFINFIAISTAEPPRASGFPYPPAWDIDRATLHQAVRNLLQLGKQMNQDLHGQFYAWRRSQPPMPDRQPERPLGRVRPQSRSGSATSKPTNSSGQEQQTQEPPSDLLQAQPKQTSELTSRPLGTSSQPEGVPGSFPEGTPVSRSAASQSAPPIFSSLATQSYIPPPNFCDQPLAYRQASARGQESARRSLHRRSQPDLSRPVEPPIPEQPGPILRLSLEGPSPDPPQVDMGSRNEPEPGSGPPNPVQASSGPLNPAGSADLFGNLRALLREELQGHARDAAERQNVFETAIRQDFERFQREMQRQMHNQNQHCIENRQQDVHISGGNNYPPYRQENDEFYARECQRRHFSRDQRQPSVRGGSNGFQHPNERQRMPPPPPLDDNYDDVGSELTEANLGRFHWKTEDVGYFHPDRIDDDGALTEERGSKTFYRDIYSFTDRIRDVALFKGELVVKVNIHSCLRGSALEWYTIELTREEKKRLRDSSLEEGWLGALTARFKPRTAEAMNRLQDMSYGYKDVRAGRTPRAFAQEFLRNARSADIGDVYNQITMAWNKLEGSLRVHIPEPSPHTTVAEFLDQLDAKYGIWKDMTRDRDRKMKDPKTKARPQSRPQEPHTERRNPADRESFRYRPNQTSYQASRWPYQQAWTPWVPPPSRPLHPYVASNQATQGSQKIAGYFGNDQKHDRNERRGTQQNDRKPWNQWKSSAQQQQQQQQQQPLQPQPAQQAYLAQGMTEFPGPFPAYWSAAAPPVPYALSSPMPATLLGGYYADAAEEPYQEGFVETEYSDDNVEQLDHETDSDSGTEPDGEQALLAKAHTVAGTCHRCWKEFASRNALYDHLAGCQKDKTAPVSNAFLANAHDLPVIESETNCLPASDRLCRSWRYLTASIGIHSKSHMDKICLDTGCTRTLIDERTALDLHLEPQDANPIAVSGIGSLHESSKTVSFDAYIPGQVGGHLVLGKLPITAYLVKDLPAKLLLGMNVMGPEGFEIDLWQRKGKIHACHELEFPFQIQSKPNRVRIVPVYAAGRFILPPHTRGRIPVRVKQKLPRDRDFIFEPFNRTGYTMYTQLVDADFAWIEVENKTPRTIIIGRRSRLGYVSDADFAIAAEVDPNHAYLAASDPAARTLAAQTIDLRAERLATCNGHETPDTTPNSLPPPEPPPDPSQPPLRITKDLPATVLKNGISVYGTAEQVRKLSDLISQYKIWGNSPKGNMASIPRDQWMTIPLVEGWEKRMPKPKVYRLGKKDKDLVDATLDQLHEEGKVSWADGHTPSAYPVFVVWRKIIKDGKPVMKGRVVVDIRHLNSISEPDLYPVPSQEEILNMLRGKRYITVVDAKQCFHQWPVQPEHRRRLAIISHRGQEVFNVAIMGYVNSVAFVQRQMDLTLHEFADFCRCYIDDIVIASATFDEHLSHLHQVFARLQSLNLSLDPKKSFIGYPSVQLLGQHVDAFGLTTDEEKIAGIQRLRFPETLRQLESYLGITGYLRHYIPKYASIVAPLCDRKTRLLKGAPKGGKDRKYWSVKAKLSEPTYQELAAYQRLQAEFARPRFLTHHDPDRQLYVDLDASADGHGAMVYHVKPDYTHADLTKPPVRTAIQPVCFLSRGLTSAESRYWPTEMETSCLVWVVRKIRHMIEAAPKHMPVVIYSDHSATANISRQTSLDSVATEHLNLRLIRASQYLQQFNLRVHHRPGNTNLVADGLSRLPRGDAKPKDGELDLDELLEHCFFAPISHCWLGASEVHLDAEFMKRIKKEYQNDTRCSAIIRVLRDTKHEDKKRSHEIPYKLENGLLFLLKDSGELWLVIPKGLNREVFQMIHDNQGHCGLDTAIAKMQGLALYKGIYQLRKYIQTCPCRLSSIPHHKPYGYLNPIRTPDGPYQILTMDFMVSLPTTDKGNNQILVAVDKFSKQIGLVAGSSEWDAEQWGEELILFMQTADWGLPVRIISDRDPRFVAGVWRGMFEALGVLWLYSTAWHPQTDGQTERSIQVVETMMRHQLVLEPKLQSHWERLLPPIQAALNSSKKTSTGLSPHELMYGQPLRQPWNLLRRISDRTFALRQDAQEALAYNVPANKRLSRKLGQQFAGPFEVLQRVGRVAYRLDFPSKLKIHPVVSISQLEPFEEDPHGRWPDKPGPTIDEDFPEDGDRYEVERIVDRKVQLLGRKRKPVIKYLVRWKGYGSEDDWWLTKEQLEGAEDLVEGYDRIHPF